MQEILNFEWFFSLEIKLNYKKWFWKEKMIELLAHTWANIASHNSNKQVVKRSQYAMRKTNEVKTKSPLNKVVFSCIANSNQQNNK